ncbi:MAG TPA: hypothetical protein VI957_02535 [Candidatus Paceibacterota bacterium]
MGDGSKRKGNDKVRINKPKPRPSGIGGGGGGGGSGSSSERDINKVCPAAFDVQIRPKGAIKDGTSVTVRGTELFVLSESVGHLKPQHVSTIKECAARGIKYTARVVNTTNRAYARFEQTVG